MLPAALRAPTRYFIKPSTPFYAYGLPDSALALALAVAAVVRLAGFLCEPTGTPHRIRTSGTPSAFRHLAEAKPMAPPRTTEAPGFRSGPVRDARSAEWERMTAVSLAVMNHGVIR